MTQEQLAEKLGVSNKTISKWETGKCMPDYGIVKSLCDELEITIAKLMDGVNAPKLSASFPVLLFQNKLQPQTTIQNFRTGTRNKLSQAV